MAEKKHIPFRERLAAMTREERIAALRAIGEWERTHHAEFWARLYAQADHLEVRESIEEDRDLYDAVYLEVLARHPELAED